LIAELTTSTDGAKKNKKIVQDLQE